MNNITDFLKKLVDSNLGTPILLIVLLGMMILPLPPFILDILFTFNIVFALIVILATIYCKRPLEFAVFPTVILISTLLRLALNIASTRVVLLYGHTGTDAAGQVIKSFGEVVIGGNYTVGLVIFLILVVINFVVVTKGAGRVSEVSARFTLDSLPGKQMAIDADLNAGIINQQEALLRRDEIAQESDFYGSMDGASKFVRGDAVAGIVILLINIVGGLIIGVTQHGMTFSDAGHNYVLLTIGDGLVAQIPSLLLSTGAAIMVTRFSKSHDMGSAVVSQVFANRNSLWIVAAILFGLGIIPGMPHASFLSFSILLSGIAYYMKHKKDKDVLALAKESAEEEASQQPEKTEELSWDDVTGVDVIGLEVGYRLIPLVDSRQGGQLLSRVKGVRKKLSQQLGFLISTVHIKDNLDLEPTHYRISIAGVTMGQNKVFPDQLLAINPGQVFGELKGTKTTDPAFGLDAYWIMEADKEKAQSLGYTVVDPSTVIATHLSHLLEMNAQKLLGFDETQSLLDKLGQTSGKLVKELVPDLLSTSTVTKVLQMLLSEGIPLTDFKGIVESMAEIAPKTKDPDEILQAVRLSLSGLITEVISHNMGELPIITLQPELEQILTETVSQTNGNAFEPSMAEKLQGSISKYVKDQELKNEPTVVVVQPSIRQLLARFVRTISSKIYVLSYQEIPETRQIKIVGSIG